MKWKAVTMEQTKLIEIGNRIAKERHRLGYTQSELGVECDLNLKTISLLENGQRVLKVDTLMKLCKALNVSADYLLYGETLDSNAKYIRKKLSQISEKQSRAFIDVLDAFTE